MFANTAVFLATMFRLDGCNVNVVNTYMLYYDNYYWKWGVYNVVIAYSCVVFPLRKGLKNNPTLIWANISLMNKLGWFSPYILKTCYALKWKKNSTPGLRLRYVYKSTPYQHPTQMRHGIPPDFDFHVLYYLLLINATKELFKSLNKTWIIGFVKFYL